MNYWLLLIPVITVFTGWITVVLIYHSFLRGIPRFQSQLAQYVGEFANKELSSTDMESLFDDPRNFQNIKPLVETHVDNFLRKKLPVEMPMIGMFIGDKTIDTLKTIFIREVESLFPQVMGQFAGNLSRTTMVGDYISSRLSAMSPETIKSALRPVLQKVYTKACMAGILIGVIAGIAQLLILLLV